MDKPHAWMLEDQRTDGAYIIPRKPTTAECTGLDFEAELRAHKRVVERLYKRNTADVRAQKRAQVQHDSRIVYTSVNDWITRAVEPHQAKSRLAHPDKLPGYPDAPQLENCASPAVHTAIQARQAELYREFRRERLKFQGKDAYANQLARASSSSGGGGAAVAGVGDDSAAAAAAGGAAAAAVGAAAGGAAAGAAVGAAAGAAAGAAVGAAVGAAAGAAGGAAAGGAAAGGAAAGGGNDLDTLATGGGDDSDASDFSSNASSKRKRESEAVVDGAAAKRQRVYKKRTALQKAVGKQKNAERANIIAENRRTWQKANYSKRAEKNKAYLKEWRTSEKGKEITAYHHAQSASGAVQLSSSAAARGYAQSLHPDQVTVLCALPCIYCGVTDNINVDRVINTADYSLDNCVPCCTICNHMKSELQLGTFLSHRERIAQFQIDRIIIPTEEDGSLKRGFSKYQKSAIERGIDWSLDKDQFELLTRLCSSCYFCGDSDNFMGIDRKDNDIGYTVTNVLACCKKCNYFKWNLTVDAFLAKCRRGVDWVTLHPIDVARSAILKKMPSGEQMATTLVVHATQDARKIRKPPPVIPPDAPVYFLKNWKIKKFHLFLDCGGGRAGKDGAVKWQSFATQTIPRRLVPEGITLCLSCVNAQSSLHAHAPAVTFTSDEAALEWLQSASSAFNKGGVAAAEQPSRDAVRMKENRATETDEHKAERLQKAALYMRKVRANK